ncbi:MAG: aspartate carbamoyltransferase [Anaerolineae bacterium]
MELIKSNRPNLTLLLIVITTAVIGTGLLYSFDWIAMKNTVHTEGAVHTNDMDHREMHGDRQQEVAERGLMIMPFDLDRSTHNFEKAPFGGIQQVVSDDGDLSQIQLIQSHLIEEVERFQNGDFDDPAMIHGDDMPGLTELQVGFQDIEVVYESMPDGGKIIYSTVDNELKDAIHVWFEAQLSDHGVHATGN